MNTLLLSAMLACQAPSERIEGLIRDLNADEPAARDKAVAELCEIGPPALAALEKAAADGDPTARALAQKAIHGINWGKGEEALRKYVEQRFDEKTEMEEASIKAVEPFLPDVRFYRITETPDAGGGGMAAMVMAGQTNKTSLFALRRGQPGFTRISLKGIFAPPSLVRLLKERQVSMATDDEALDFAAAFFDLYSELSGSGSMSYVVGYGGPSLERTDSGWVLSVSNYGISFTFTTDEQGIVTDIRNSGSNAYGLATHREPDEREALEIEKLKLEMELLRRQLEKKD